VGIKFTTLAEISTDCIGKYKFNYQFNSATFYCPCPKSGPGFTMPYVKASFVLQWIDIRVGCSFC